MTFTRETGTMTTFDGYEGDASYVDKIYDELNVFSQGCCDIITGAKGYVSSRPNDYDAPNYLLYTSGTAPVWPKGKGYSDLIAKTKTPQQIFQDNYLDAQNNWNTWLEKIA